MATREYGFMGEKFPSKKFRQMIAKFLGHDENVEKSEPAWHGEFTQSVKPEPPPSLDYIAAFECYPAAPEFYKAKPIPKSELEEYTQRVQEAAARIKILQPYQSMVDDYKRKLQMAEIQLKNSIPERSPSYDEVLEENKTLKAKCEAFEEREQVVIDSILECFGKRPVILDDIIHVPGETYNEMVRKINKVRTPE